MITALARFRQAHPRAWELIVQSSCAALHTAGAAFLIRAAHHHLNQLTGRDAPPLRGWRGRRYRSERAVYLLGEVNGVGLSLAAIGHHVRRFALAVRGLPLPAGE